MAEREASFYEQPFKYIKENVFSERSKNNRANYRDYWWRHAEARPGLLLASRRIHRVLVTPEVSTHRLFRWLPVAVLPDHKLQVFARSDDAFAGILMSRVHTAWSLRVGSWHGAGNDPRYTISTCFGTFPFPAGLTPNLSADQWLADPRAVAIAAAARELDEARERWLNPPELIKIVPEVVSGYPDRLFPKNDKAAAILKQRTMTKLYNEMPIWLENLHEDLDRAVLRAYGWPIGIKDEELLAQLFELNQSRKGIGE